MIKLGIISIYMSILKKKQKKNKKKQNKKTKQKKHITERTHLIC